MVEPAQRIKQLPRYLFAEIDRKIREKVAEGVDVIRLGIGDPDHPTPEYIINRMSSEITLPRNHRYPPDEGVGEFKEAITAYYKERHNVELDPQREVLPLIGTKEGIANISFSYVDPGELNLVPDPGYPVYSIGTLFAGGETYKMPLNKENSYLPDLKAIPLEVARRAKLLFINYPNNPTGAVANLDYFRQVARFAKQHGILVCHDAAYSELVYDGKRPLSFLEAEGAKEVGIEFNSLSKTFNMTGWRVGFAVGNQQAIEVLGRFKTNIDSGLFGAIQFTGVEALNNPERDKFIASLRARYQERRDIVTGGLARLGWPPISSPGAFYIWAPVPGGFTSQQFVAMLLEETGVVVTPGRGFGEYGEGYFRIALTVESDRLQEAMERVGKVIKFS